MSDRGYRSSTIGILQAASRLGTTSVTPLRRPAISVMPSSIPTNRIIWVGLIVCLANAVLLVLQLVAGRLLAPYIGVSLETWTAVIGVFLTGISLGNFFGGKLADRAANNRVLGMLLIAGAVCTAGMLLPLTTLRSVPLGPRIPLAAFALCLPVSFVLSLITPVAIRALLPDVTHTGRIVGLVYALGTLGSLAGNFLTGFVLIAFFTTTTIVWVCAATLTALGFTSLVRRESESPIQTLNRVLPSSIGNPQSAIPNPQSPLLSPSTACSIVFIASFCSMALEIGASRMLAPVVGVSLYSWTGIIGVVLLGIVVGNYFGGWLADKSPQLETLGTNLFYGGLFALVALLMFNVLSNWGGFLRLGLIPQILAWTAALFFAPMCLLGTISPLVTRLAVGEVAHAGRVAGRIYAWSCAGAIAGTFATGWWLIAAIEVKSVVLVVAAVLMILSSIIGRPWRRPGELFGSAIVLGAAVVGIIYQQYKMTDVGGYYDETNYYTIRTSETTHNDEPVTALQLDHLVHSYAKPNDPEYLGYEHEWVQADFAQLMAERTNGAPRILVIGGGGYTYPRWLEAKLPKSIIEVAEIDPGVTEAAHKAMGLSRDTRIRSFHMDGRQYVEERAPKGGYQLIVQDAVNDLSVPYHIMTKEYNDAVKALLDPDGVYLLTVIDDYDYGQLMRSAVRTMKKTFPHVGLMAASDLWKPANSSGLVGRQVWVIYGSQKPFDQTALANAVQKQTKSESRTRIMPADELDAYLAAGPPIILTDTYAPVDNLISVIFRMR